MSRVLKDLIGAVNPLKTNSSEGRVDIRAEKSPSLASLACLKTNKRATFPGRHPSNGVFFGFQVNLRSGSTCKPWCCFLGGVVTVLELSWLSALEAQARRLVSHGGQDD